MKRFVWLFGENLGNTANNNSYCFWRQIVEKEDDIDKYFVLSKNSQNSKIYDSLSNKVKKYIVWRNSFKHFMIYMKADMFFVTLSYRDVRPEQFLWKKYNFLTETPVIYLQHGTLAMKLLGYNGKDYNNNMFRFVYYNSRIKDDLIKVNGFKEYQLHYGEFHPRYKELILKNDAYLQERKKIFWFVTWREYLGDNVASKMLYLIIERILSDYKFQRYLEENDFTLELCFHDQFDVSNVNRIFEKVDCPNIKWSHASEINVMDELIACNLLITDYSSVGFDVTMLNKPVILFIPDFEEYSKKRKFYCDIEELKEIAIFSPRKLIDDIIKHNYGVNTFFRTRLPEKIDYEYIRSGKHIEKMYDYYSEVQRHQIAFIGYNFYGIGGTVLATKAMAEALLERGYLVRLISLKKTKKPKNMPNALNINAIYDARTKTTKREWYKKRLFHSKAYYEFLVNDKDQKNLIPYAGYGLKKWLLNSNCETIISTRESLHPFLYKYASENVKNKIYYFHCSPMVFDEIFPDLVAELKNYIVEKAVFVTDGNRRAFVEKYDYIPYDKYLVLGNPLDSSRMIERDEIQKVEEKEIYTGMYLLRISREREKDIENLLEYGRFLKSRGIQDIRIDVFGTGDLLEKFLKTIVFEELTEYIRYCGQTPNPKFEFARHDALVDFSLAHSFGMPYIEGILNGKMVYCMKNQGSEEVLEGIPDVFMESFEDLTQKILKLPQYTIEDLTRNYDIISEKYSRDAISRSFIEYIDQ